MTCNVCGVKPALRQQKQTFYYYSKDSWSVQEMGPWETQVDVWKTMKRHGNR